MDPETLDLAVQTIHQCDEAMDRLREGMSELAALRRGIIVRMRYSMGMSVSDIAGALVVTRQAVYHALQQHEHGTALVPNDF
jgi:predicted DNA-binding protein YlxM (UPF0122 family)